MLQRLKGKNPLAYLAVVLCILSLCTVGLWSGSHVQTIDWDKEFFDGLYLYGECVDGQCSAYFHWKEGPIPVNMNDFDYMSSTWFFEFGDFIVCDGGSICDCEDAHIGYRGIAVQFPLWWLAAAFAALPLSLLVFRVARSFMRRRSGRCARCGYQLEGNTSGWCPECGTCLARGEEDCQDDSLD